MRRKTVASDRCLWRPIATAIGGENVTTVIQGRERYPVSVRYPRELRDDVERLRRVLIATPTGAQVPLAQVADIRIVHGPAMVRNENGFLAGYVYVDITGRDLGGYVADAKERIARELELPAGYSLAWSGQYEYLQRAVERLKLVLPLTLSIIVLLLYLNFRNARDVGLILFSLPFALVGGVSLLYILGYDLSIAAAVGFIALAGVAAETGVVMVMYLEHA